MVRAMKAVWLDQAEGIDFSDRTNREDPTRRPRRRSLRTQLAFPKGACPDLHIVTQITRTMDGWFDRVRNGDLRETHVQQGSCQCQVVRPV